MSSASLVQVGAGESPFLCDPHYFMHHSFVVSTLTLQNCIFVFPAFFVCAYIVLVCRYTLQYLKTLIRNILAFLHKSIILLVINIHIYLVIYYNHDPLIMTGLYVSPTSPDSLQIYCNSLVAIIERKKTCQIYSIIALEQQ